MRHNIVINLHVTVIYVYDVCLLNTPVFVFSLYILDGSGSSHATDIIYCWTENELLSLRRISLYSIKNVDL